VRKCSNRKPRNSKLDSGTLAWPLIGRRTRLTLTGPTVAAGKRHTQPLLSDAYMFMYPSSFQLVYGRSPPFARRPHRLFASPEDTPLTHPIGEHQVAGPTVLAAGKRHTQPPL
jgi:hypothetical protein